MSGEIVCPEFTQLGAFVLGSLPPEEMAAIDQHLLDCPSCAAELSQLETLPTVLDRLTIDDVTAEAPAAPDDLFDRVAGAISRDDKRAKRHRRLLAVAAAVVIATGTAVGVGAAVTAGGSHTTWEKFQATSGSVHMSVDLAGETTGSQLRVSVAGLPEDEHCRLVAVGRDGEHDPAGSWTATYQGAASVTGWTSYRPDQLAQLVLLGTNGRHLVTVTTT